MQYLEKFEKREWRKYLSMRVRLGQVQSRTECEESIQIGMTSDSFSHDNEQIAVFFQQANFLYDDQLRIYGVFWHGAVLGYFRVFSDESASRADSSPIIPSW